MLTEAEHSMILGREKGIGFRNGQERRQRERRWGETDQGMMGGTLLPQPQKQKRAGAEDQCPFSPKAPAPLAAPGPLASSLIHLNEQILDVLDLALY